MTTTRLWLESDKTFWWCDSRWFGLIKLCKNCIHNFLSTRFMSTHKSVHLVENDVFTTVMFSPVTYRAERQYPPDLHCVHEIHTLGAAWSVGPGWAQTRSWRYQHRMWGQAEHRHGPGDINTECGARLSTDTVLEISTQNVGPGWAQTQS